VTNQRRVIKLKCRRLHRPRRRGNVDRGANLLEKRGVVEKNRFAPQLFALEMPNDDRAHAHRLSGCRPTQKSPKVSSAPFVFSHNTVFVRAENTADSYGKIGEPSQCLRYRSAVCSGPTNGFGTPTTSLKQSDVMPAIKASCRARFLHECARPPSVSPKSSSVPSLGLNCIYVSVAGDETRDYPSGNGELLAHPTLAIRT